MEEKTDIAAAVQTAAPENEDAKAHKLAAAASRARVRRRLKKLKAAKSEDELNALLKEETGAPAATSKADESKDKKKPPENDGWPADEKVAAQLPGAVALVTQVLSPLKATRYGVCLEPQLVKVPQADGSTNDVHYDPLRDQLAMPVAALFASGGARLSPGWALGVGVLMVFGPMAGAHAVEAVLGYMERKEKRREQLEAARMNQLVAAAPQPPAPPKPNAAAAAAPDFSKPVSA